MALSNQHIFKDKRTKKKIDLHLSDINDEITEKDISNVQTDVTVNISEHDVEAETEADNMLHKKQEEDQDKDKREDGNNSNSVDSSWDLLK
jgi:hypothetical protein